MTAGMTVEPDPLDACAEEPIRIPGGIQPHGALVLLDPAALRLKQWSSNAADILGAVSGLEAEAEIETFVAGAGTFPADVRRWLEEGDSTYLRSHRFANGFFQVSAHRSPQGVIVEFEPGEETSFTSEMFYPKLGRFLDATEAIVTVPEIASRVAAEIRGLTGFNRVLIYRFDEDWNGTVIAENGDGVLPSYLDLRFPASDIPAQARELYRLNRLRFIPTATYTPIPLIPALCPHDNKPLDLSFSALRSVSPVHLEYMRNMGTSASMSISIIIGDKLWGLISCHHAALKLVDAQTRAACDLLGRVIAQQIETRLRSVEVTERLRLHQIETELVAHLARASAFHLGLVESAKAWLGLVNAPGAAVVTDGNILTTGTAPSTDVIAELVKWLFARRTEEIFTTNSLSSHWDGGAAITDVASGVIAVPISRIHPSYLLWFRPEEIQTVTWGGNPRGDKEADASGRLHPRLSFESWKELVRGRATSWSEAEIHAAINFRIAIVNFVLQRAEERAQLSDELQRTNKELEAFSYSISHDLRAPFRHIAGYAQLLSEEEPDLKPLSHHYLEGISHAALSAGQLVDDLLHFSQLGRASLKCSRVDMRKILEEVQLSLESEAEKRAIEWNIGDMPSCWGDPPMIRQALFNLVDNAVKYTSGRTPARISVSGTERDGTIVYSVSDNGVGFDMAYAGKLFQVFQRLHRPEDFTGTGIGLALAKRIVDRHGGTIEARGRIGEGATFSISLPAEAKKGSNVAT